MVESNPLSSEFLAPNTQYPLTLWFSQDRSGFCLLSWSHYLHCHFLQCPSLDGKSPGVLIAPSQNCPMPCSCWLRFPSSLPRLPSLVDRLSYLLLGSYSALQHQLIPPKGLLLIIQFSAQISPWRSPPHPCHSQSCNSVFLPL